MPTDPVASRDALVAAVESGELDRDRVEQAVHRQLTVLLEQELAQQAEPNTPAADPGSSGALAAEVSAAALTLVSGPCREPLVGPRVTPLGEAQVVDRFTAAAQRAGLEVGPGGTTVSLRGPGAGPASADVVVALDTPYLLGGSAAPVRLALFGDTPGAMTALVDVLTGQAAAPGRLPVPVTGVGDPAGC
jgi:beta-N-acetylhexosaminidase